MWAGGSRGAFGRCHLAGRLLQAPLSAGARERADRVEDQTGRFTSARGRSAPSVTVVPKPVVCRKEQTEKKSVVPSRKEKPIARHSVGV